MAEKKKSPRLKTKLKPHQERVVERISQPDQPGLLVAHPLGSGKTLTSIAASQHLGLPTNVILPAALRENYIKELAKHIEGELPVEITSQTKLVRDGHVHPGGLQVLDEAHRARNFEALLGKKLKNIPADKRLLMTASPFYNNPADIAIPLNLVAGSKVLPDNPREFRDRYIKETKVDPGWLSRLLYGAKPGVKYEVNPSKAKELQSVFGKFIDYVPPITEDYPARLDETVNVTMTPKQEDYYKAILGTAPAWIRYKIREGLPPSKQESKQLNAYMAGARQIANTTKAYQTEGDEHAPKIDAAEKELHKALKENPESKAVVYSNYLESGLDPYRQRLEKSKIPYGVFTGGMSDRERKDLVDRYNEGKIKALLLSSAGGEGLDLKGTRLIQILEPHFNEEKIKQVIGRGIRYKSHAHLPEEHQNVRVQRFISQHPEPGRLGKFFGFKRPKSVDEYLTMMSGDKEHLHQQFRALIEKAQKQTEDQMSSAKAASLIQRLENSVDEITKEASKLTGSAMSKSLKSMDAGDKLWKQRPALIGKKNIGRKRLMDPGTENSSRRLSKALL